MTEDKSGKYYKEINLVRNVGHRPKKCLTECKICGGPALYSSYGVVVCDPCRKFFRRNANKNQDELRCIYGDHCEINLQNRHICSSCRLAKCFRTGMQMNMFRPARTSNNNIKQRQEMTTICITAGSLEEKHEPQQLPTLNLLRSDQSTLTTDQWTLLSNLVHCFDEYSGFSFAQNFVQEENKLPPKRRFKIVSVQKYIQVLGTTGSYLYTNNPNFRLLSSHDRSILLRNTMKYITTMATSFIMRYTGILENPTFYQSIEMIYGSFSLTTGYRSAEQIDSDCTVVKLVLAILAFSTLDYVSYTNMPPINIIDIKTVLHIQDTYTELLWKYLLHRYGHEQAVKCLSKLIRYLLLMNDVFGIVHDCTTYIHMMDLFIKQIENTLILTE